MIGRFVSTASHPPAFGRRGLPGRLRLLAEGARRGADALRKEAIEISRIVKSSEVRYLRDIIVSIDQIALRLHNDAVMQQRRSGLAGAGLAGGVKPGWRH